MGYGFLSCHVGSDFMTGKIKGPDNSAGSIGLSASTVLRRNSPPEIIASNVSFGRESEVGMYTQGNFAFSDTTDRGQHARSVHLRLPPIKRACKEGTHTFSEYLGCSPIKGTRMMLVRCPDCFEELAFPELAKDRPTP